MRRRTRNADFRPIEEVAASAGRLLPRRDRERGRHLAALAAWRAAVGERLQRRTRVARVGRDCMTVEVPDAAWSATLKKLESEILGRVRRTLGPDAPQRLEFQISPGIWRPATRPRPTVAPPEPPPEDAGSPAAPAAPVSLRVAATALTEEEISVSDPELRRRLCRVANRYLERAAGGRRLAGRTDPE